MVGVRMIQFKIVPGHVYPLLFRSELPALAGAVLAGG